MRNIFIIICLWFCMIAGCSASLPQTSSQDNLIAPILPAGEKDSDKNKIATKWYIDWADEGDISDKDIKDFLFIASPKGRDWRAPAGPDGYLLRVILLDRDEKPCRKDGRIQAFLIRNHGSRDAEPICAWDISPTMLSDYYDESAWPGYVLPLDWGKGPKKTDGCYLLVIRWISPDGKARLTRNTIFEEAVAVETNTYRRSVNAGGSSSNPVGGGKSAGSGAK